MARYALDLMLEFGSTSPEDRKMLAVCQMLVDFYALLDSESMFFTPAAAEKIRAIGLRMGVLYSSLSAEALANSEKLWKTSPKLHLFCHLCEWQSMERGNPRFYWCYPDEDLVGQMIEIGQSVHTGTLAVSCLCKWLILLFE